MRTIKFRGKTLKTIGKGGKATYEYVYGNLISNKIPCKINLTKLEKAYGLSENTHCLIDTGTSLYKVNSNTIGQYIGILDNKYTEIYSNDYIKIIGDNELYAVTWKDCGYILEGLTTGKQRNINKTKGIYVINLDDYTEDTSLQALISTVIKSKGKYQLVFGYGCIHDKNKYSLSLYQNYNYLYETANRDNLAEMTKDALKAMNVPTNDASKLPMFMMLLSTCYKYKLGIKLSLNLNSECKNTFIIYLYDNDWRYRDIWEPRTDNVLTTSGKKELRLNLLEDISKFFTNLVEDRLQNVIK